MTTSKTIAALLGPTLVASALSLLANLGTSQTLIEGLSQSPALIMIAGYAAFVPGLAIVYFHNRWTNGWPVLVTVIGMALAGRRPPAHGVFPHSLPQWRQKLLRPPRASFLSSRSYSF
jgi:hypothetical protein